jgi:hypothetical protein
MASGGFRRPDDTFGPGVDRKEVSYVKQHTNYKSLLLVISEGYRPTNILGLQVCFKPLFKGLGYCDAGCSVHTCMHNVDFDGG